MKATLDTIKEQARLLWLCMEGIIQQEGRQISELHDRPASANHGTLEFERRIAMARRIGVFSIVFFFIFALPIAGQCEFVRKTPQERMALFGPGEFLTLSDFCRSRETGKTHPNFRFPSPLLFSYAAQAEAGWQSNAAFSEAPQGAWMGRLNPFGSVTASAAGWTAAAGYDYDIYDYDSIPGYREQYVGMLAGWEGGVFRVSAKQLFSRYRHREGLEEDVDRQDRDDNEIRLEAAARWDSLELILGFEDIDNNYQSNDSLMPGVLYDNKDCAIKHGDAQLVYSLAEKLSVFAEIDLRDIIYEEHTSSESRTWDALCGLRGAWIKNCEVKLKAGYRSQEYAPGTHTMTAAHDDFKRPVLKAILAYALPEAKHLELLIEHTNEESLYNELDFYETYRSSVRYSQPVAEDTEGRAQVIWFHNTYPEASAFEPTREKRADDTFSIEGTLSRQLTGEVSVYLRGRHVERQSTISRFCFASDEIFVGTTCGF
jgi:hypothetical protein